jgi:hypothetical protein
MEAKYIKRLVSLMLSSMVEVSRTGMGIDVGIAG